MTGDILPLKTKQADQGSWKQVRPWQAWLGGLGIGLGIFGLSMALHDNPPITLDEIVGRVDVMATPDSPGLHLVGEVTKKRHYGIFHTPARRGSVSHLHLRDRRHRDLRREPLLPRGRGRSGLSNVTCRQEQVSAYWYWAAGKASAKGDLSEGGR